MTTKTKSTTTKKKLKVTNIGPVRDFTCEISPGMNLLEAQNGAGKTCILTAIARATGADLPVEVTDGATTGKLELDDTVLLSLTRSKAKLDPSVEVSLASVSPLAIVIDPGIKDRKAAETQRIRSLLQLVDLKTSEEVLATLVDEDEGAIDVLAEIESIEDLITLDPVAAAGKVKRALEAHKRSMLQQAEQAHGRWQATKPDQKPERMSSLTRAEAQKAYDEAVGNRRQAEGEWNQRRQREAERAEFAENAGERPDVEAAQFEMNTYLETVRVANVQVANLEKQLEVARVQAAHAKDESERRQNALQNATRLVQSWDRRKAILDSEITGADETEVKRATSAVAHAYTELETAMATAEYRLRLEASEAARTDRDRYTALAEKYETLAKSVPARLASLLDQAGIPNLTVEDGILTVVHEGGELEPFHRLSAGERTRFAMPLFISRNPGRLVAFPESFWNALEAESKVEVATILEEYGVIGISEMATMRGDPLKVEHFEVE